MVKWAGLNFLFLVYIVLSSFRSSIAAMICEKEENQQTKITFTESHLSMGTIGHKINSTKDKLKDMDISLDNI